MEEIWDAIRGLDARVAALESRTQQELISQDTSAELTRMREQIAFLGTISQRDEFADDSITAYRRSIASVQHPLLTDGAAEIGPSVYTFYKNIPAADSDEE